MCGIAVRVDGDINCVTAKFDHIKQHSRHVISNLSNHEVKKNHKGIQIVTIFHIILIIDEFVRIRLVII